MLRHPTASRYKFVRRVKGKFQARVWDGRVRSHVNLGLYDHERAAWDASKRFFLRGEWPAGIMPHFVRESAGGYIAGVAIGSEHRLIRRVGPFPTPCEAHVALLAVLVRIRIDSRQKSHDPRRLINADNPAIAAFCVLAKPWPWTWPADLLPLITEEMVEDCRRRIDRGGGYAQAAKRWAGVEQDGTPVRLTACGVIRCQPVVIERV